MDSTFSKFVIPNLIQTKWGDKSIIYIKYLYIIFIRQYN